MKKIKNILLVTFLLLITSLGVLYSPDIPVSELKKKYSNEFSKFISIDGMDVHYRDEGIGDAIVFN